MDRNSFKIYCAGPLFNPMERKEMAKIADALKKAGYCVFLPQEDGLEFSKLYPAFIKCGINETKTNEILNEAIFSLDVFEVLDADGLILNMNGRVPDEGAMVEAGMAWSHEKVVVIYNSDDRSLIQGSCNPLVLGLSNFETVSSYEEIVHTFERKFRELGSCIISSRNKTGFENAKYKGKTIRDFLNSKKNEQELANLLIDLFGENLCRDTKDVKGKCFQADTLQ